MKSVRASCIPDFQVLMSNETNYHPYPLLRSSEGDRTMLCVSPLHGRSYVVDKVGERYIVSKGNGLSYSQYTFMNTREFGDDTWGLLLKSDAFRDFELGNEISKLGIKTNHMEYVLELNQSIQLSTGHILKPILLQYDVECPFRIADAPFMSREQMYNEAIKWKSVDKWNCPNNYLIAANILIENLRILHENDILHNAIHSQNYTWALELLDFELSYSKSHPYSREDDRRHVKDLFPREIIQTYEIITFIAGALHEDIDYQLVDNLFIENGFDINALNVCSK